MTRAPDIPNPVYRAILAGDREAQQTVARCAFCPKWRAEGTLAETRAAHAKHRARKHPEIQPVKRIRRRVNVLTISPKTVEENIAGVRGQGGATWERVA